MMTVIVYKAFWFIKYARFGMLELGKLGWREVVKLWPSG